MVRAQVSPLGFNDNAKPICFVNGKRYDLPLGRGEATLLQFLRGWYSGASLVIGTQR